MCPGGFIVPAASGPEQVVVNGMSPSNRGSRWSNSGMVVEIQPEDLMNGEWKMENGELAAQQKERLLAVNPLLSSSQLSAPHAQLTPLHFQEELERQCWLQGGQTPDGAGTTHAGLYPQEVKLRFTGIFIQSGIDFFSTPFLDAGVYQ